MIKLLLIGLVLCLSFILWCMLRIASFEDAEMMMLSKDIEKIRNK